MFRSFIIMRFRGFCFVMKLDHSTQWLFHLSCSLFYTYFPSHSFNFRFYLPSCSLIVSTSFSLALHFTPHSDYQWPENGASKLYKYVLMNWRQTFNQFESTKHITISLQYRTIRFSFYFSFSLNLASSDLLLSFLLTYHFLSLPIIGRLVKNTRTKLKFIIQKDTSKHHHCHRRRLCVLDDYACETYTQCRDLDNKLIQNKTKKKQLK